MIAKRWLAPIVLSVFLAWVVGCSGGPKGNFATVSGTVTHNGAPVEGARVTLYSTTEVGGRVGIPYGAQTDSSGKYLIATVGKDPGIPPGMYKVTVTKLEQKGPNLPKEGWDAGQMEASGMSRNLMPKDYEDPVRTKLSVTVEAGKNENKNFELKGAASTTKGVGAVP